MTPLLKGGVALLTVGTVSTAGYFGGTYLFGGTPIKDWINEEFEYILLDTNEDAETNKDKTKWQEIWKNYKTNSNNVFKLAGWKEGQVDFDLTKELKKKCKELSETKVSDNKDTTYSNVTSYCGRRVTIKDQLDKDKLVAIDTVATANTPWDGIAKNKTELGIHFTNLEIKPSPGTEITADNVKTGCKGALEKDKSKTNFSTIYDSFKAVCVTKG